MADYGITETGFVRKRLGTIKEELEAEFTTAFGPVNTGADSVNGQIIGIFSKVAADIWELAEEVYHSQYPNSAEGVPLENGAKLVGVTRLAATKTTAVAVVTGSEGLTVAAGKLVGADEGDDYFEVHRDALITRAALIRATVEVIQAADDTDYICSVNTVDFTVNSGSEATVESIATALAAAVNAGDEPVTATDNEDGTYTLLTDDTDYVTTFALEVDTRQKIAQRGSYALLVAQETGPVAAPAGSLNTIVTPVSGWDEVINLAEGDTGRDIETDAELRIRRKASVRVPGAAALSPIEARLRQEVDGVTYAKAYENDTMETAGSRPAKSIEVVVVGGSDSDVAEQIWAVKAAGIETYGDQTVSITDSNGDLQTVKFSRPTAVYVWIGAELTLYDEESFPSDGLTAAAEAILAHGQELEIGEDVIIQRFLGSIFSAVSGIAHVDITVATSATAGGAPGSYSSDDLDIGETQLADFASARISVTIP